MANSKWRIANGKLRGFTLIEMLVVFALIGFLTITGVSAFFSYSRNQAFRTSVSDVAYLLGVAKTRAISQVKPSQCGTQVLRGYEVSFTIPGSVYRLRALCDTTYYVLQSNSLASDVSFEEGSATNIFFAVSTGILAQEQTVTIVGNSTSKVIRVDAVGNVIVE